MSSSNNNDTSITPGQGQVQSQGQGKIATAGTGTQVSTGAGLVVTSTTHNLKGWQVWLANFLAAIRPVTETFVLGLLQVLATGVILYFSQGKGFDLVVLVNTLIGLAWSYWTSKGRKYLSDVLDMALAEIEHYSGLSSSLVYTVNPTAVLALNPASATQPAPVPAAPAIVPTEPAQPAPAAPISAATPLPNGSTNAVRSGESGTPPAASIISADQPPAAPLA